MIKLVRNHYTHDFNSYFKSVNYHELESTMRTFFSSISSQLTALNADKHHSSSHHEFITSDVTNLFTTTKQCKIISSICKHCGKLTNIEIINIPCQEFTSLHLNTSALNLMKQAHSNLTTFCDLNFVSDFTFRFDAYVMCLACSRCLFHHSFDITLDDNSFSLLTHLHNISNYEYVFKPFSEIELITFWENQIMKLIKEIS